MRAPTPHTKKRAQYIYGFIGNLEREKEFGPIGINDQAVYTVSFQTVSAVVSDCCDKKIRPQRAHVAAHQRVLKTILAEQTPLPMAFGMIAGQNEIQTLIESNIESLETQLERIEGKVEMSLRVSWDIDNIFEFFVSAHPELRQARDTLYGTHGEPSKEQKIELGSLFDRIITEARETHTQTVIKAMEPHCRELLETRIKREKEVMNLAFLIEKEQEKEFERGLFEAANLFDDNYLFDYNGPFAPHSFMDIDLRSP